jgi:hypothetical protein
MEHDLLQSTIFMVKKRKADLNALANGLPKDYSYEQSASIRKKSMLDSNLDLIRKDNMRASIFDQSRTEKQIRAQVSKLQAKISPAKDTKRSINHRRPSPYLRNSDVSNGTIRVSLPHIRSTSNGHGKLNAAANVKKNGTRSDIASVNRRPAPYDMVAGDSGLSIEEMICLEYRQKSEMGREFEFPRDQEFEFPRKQEFDAGRHTKTVKDIGDTHGQLLDVRRVARDMRTKSIGMCPDVTISLLESVGNVKFRHAYAHDEVIPWKTVIDKIDFNTVMNEGQLTEIYESIIKTGQNRFSPRSAGSLSHLHSFYEAVTGHLDKLSNKSLWLRINAILASFLATKFGASLDQRHNNCFLDLMACLVSVQKSLINSSCKDCRKSNHAEHRVVLAEGENASSDKIIAKSKKFQDLEGRFHELEEKLVNAKAERKMDQFSSELTNVQLFEKMNGLQEKLRYARITMINLDRDKRNLEERQDIAKQMMNAQKTRLIKMEKFITNKFKNGKKALEHIDDDDSVTSIQGNIQNNISFQASAAKYLEQKREIAFADSALDFYEHDAARNRRFTLHKSHSHKKLNNKALREVKFYKLDKRDVETSTDDLLGLKEIGCQTKISMVTKRYDTLINCQYDLDLLRQRSNFEAEVMSHVGKPSYWCFLKDDLIRSLMHLEPFTNPDSLSASNLDLVKELQEHSKDFNCEVDLDKEETLDFYTKPFDIQKIDLYVNHRLQVPIVYTESMFKYIFYSYIFAAHSLKRKVDLVEKKSDELETLFKINKLQKERITLLTSDRKILENQIETLKRAHKDCKASAFLNEFVFNLEPSKDTLGDDTEIATRAENAISSASVVESTVAFIMQKVSEIQSSMHPKVKKNTSFKSLYSKVYQFLMVRCQEVKFDEKNRIVHPMNLSEHFYKLLVEKETTVSRVEERIRTFIINIINIVDCPKISIFKRFTRLELLSEENAAMQEYLYFRAMSTIKSESRGLDISPDVSKGLNLVPFDKFESFLLKYVFPMISQISKDNLSFDIKQLCEAVSAISDFSVFKKGCIDLDAAMSAVFRYTSICEEEYMMQAAACFSTFVCLDIKCSRAISWQGLLRLHQMINMNNHNEVKLLIKKHREDRGHEVNSLKHSLDEDMFWENLEVSQAFSPLSIEPRNDPIVPVLSEEELWIIFKRYSLNDNKQTSNLTYQKFFSMLQEFGNRLFSIEKIRKYLNIDQIKIDLEFYHVKKCFEEFYEPYQSFLTNSYIMPSSRQKQLQAKMTLVNNLFMNDKFKDDHIKDCKKMLFDNRVILENDDTEISKCLMLRSLLAHRDLILDLMEVDFDQRLDYVPYRESTAIHKHTNITE